MMGKMIVDGVLQLLFPDQCCVCGRGNRLLCMRCVEQVRVFDTQYCLHCFGVSEDGRSCTRCAVQASSPLDFLLVGTSYKHSPIVARIIKTLKYKALKRSSNSIPLSLFSALRSFVSRSSKRVILVPVPLHKQRKKERGFNQAEILAQIAADFCGIEVVCMLERTIHTRPQANLQRDERLTNVQGVFSLVGPLEDVLYVIVDDVSTTRATLESCASVFREAGAKNIGGFVLARN